MRLRLQKFAMSGETFNPRAKLYQAPTEALIGLPCRRFLFPRNLTLLAAVNDVLAYLSRDYVWEGSELEILAVRNAIAQAIVSQTDCEDDDMPIGAVIAIATADTPAGYLLCDGTIYNRVDYPALFALLNANYQLDADTFKTPDLRGLFIMGGGHDDYPLDDIGGSYSVTLTTSEMPYHQHTFEPHTHGYTRPSVTPVGVAEGEEEASLVTTSTENVNYSGYMTDGGQGGSGSHQNTPPYRVLAYAIRAE